MCHKLTIHLPEFSPINFANHLVSTENLATFNHGVNIKEGDLT